MHSLVVAAVLAVLGAVVVGPVLAQLLVGAVLALALDGPIPLA